MMTSFNGFAIANHLREIVDAFQSIRNALIAKGVPMSGVPVNQYANKIRGLSNSGGDSGDSIGLVGTWMFKSDLFPNRHPSHQIFAEYYGRTNNEPRIEIELREPYKWKDPSGVVTDTANSCLGAVVIAYTTAGPITMTIVDMDDRLGEMMVLLKSGIHGPYIEYEAELNYRSPRFNYNGPGYFPPPRVVELPLNVLDWFDATSYLVDWNIAGIERDHFVVYFPDRTIPRTAVIECFMDSPTDGLRIQFEVNTDNTSYVSEYLTRQSGMGEHMSFEPPTITVPAGAPGFRFLVTYEHDVTNRQVFIRVRETQSETQPEPFLGNTVYLNGPSFNLNMGFGGAIVTTVTRVLLSTTIEPNESGFPNSHIWLTDMAGDGWALDYSINAYYDAELTRPLIRNGDGGWYCRDAPEFYLAITTSASRENAFMAKIVDDATYQSGLTDDPPVVEVPLETIEIGQTRTGELTRPSPVDSRGCYFKKYSLLWSAGQADSIAILLQSAVFDTYLSVTDANGNIVAQNDDGGGNHNTNSYLELTVQHLAHPLTIVVSSYEADRIGLFDLSVSSSQNTGGSSDGGPAGGLLH